MREWAVLGARMEGWSVWAWGARARRQAADAQSGRGTLQIHLLSAGVN